MADLVWHVGNVHTFWRAANGAVAGPDAYHEPTRPQNQAIVNWLLHGVDETANILAQADPATPAWTWGRRKNVAFIQRRVAQETTVHCWDAVAAVGPNEPVEQELAVDGVDEFLDEVLPGMSDDLDGPAQTISLGASDVDEQWVVRTGCGACHAAPAGTTAGATISATASDLLLLLWGRRQINQVHVDGDIEALRHFLARATF